MLGKITNFIKRFLYDDSIGILSKPRSPHWSTVRKNFLGTNPKCAVCGGNKNLQVHHCIPYHIDESKELCEENLIVLCEENKCHFLFGHLGNWTSYNPDVRQDADTWSKKIQNRPTL